MKWFNSKLNDPGCYFYIAEKRQGEPIGQIRFDIDGREATISISLDRRFRAQGHGSEIIRLASKKITEVSRADRINAYIRRDNTASIMSFQKAGFKATQDEGISEQQAFHLILKKEELL